MNEENRERTTIDVILVEPGQPARELEMKDNLESMQAVVGGLIEEYMPFEDEVAIICNEEGLINRMPPNRAILAENGTIENIIFGPFFICYAPIESENFLSMPEDLKHKYMEKFKEPEHFFRGKDGLMVIKEVKAKDNYEREDSR